MSNQALRVWRSPKRYMEVQQQAKTFKELEDEHRFIDNRIEEEEYESFDDYSNAV